MVSYGGGTSTVTVSPSGDSTGEADAARIMAAVAKVPAAGGLVALDPSAPWNILAGQIIITRSGVVLYAPGTAINHIGGGDLIRMYNPELFTGGNFVVPTGIGGGLDGYPVIDGSRAGAGVSRAVHAGDLFHCTVRAFAKNYTGAGSIPFHLDNQWFWTEKSAVDVGTFGCVNSLVMDQNPAAGSSDCTGSFDGGIVSAYVVTGPNNNTYNGVIFNNGTYMKTGALGITGGFASASGPAGNAAVLALIGDSPAGSLDSGIYSNLDQCRLDVGVECETGSGSNAPYTIYMGTPSNGNFISDCYGVLAFNAESTPFQTTNGPDAITFWGPVDGDSYNPGINHFVNMEGGAFLGDSSSAQNLEIFGTFQAGDGVDVTTAGTGLAVKEGSNAKQGTATLIAGSVVVANTSVTASSRIFIGQAVPGGTVGAWFVSSVTAGTGFTIKSTSSTDTSTVAYEIFEPG